MIAKERRFKEQYSFPSHGSLTKIRAIHCNTLNKVCMKTTGLISLSNLLFPGIIKFLKNLK